MRKLFTLLAALILSLSIWAQSPQKMSYQAIIRDTDNALVTSNSIGMRISILQGTTPVYVETQTSTTNINGLVTLEIGGGAVVLGEFSIIDWSAGPYFIKTETDPTGGTDYTITGTSQLLSVPYALHATTAEDITGGITETDPVFVASPASGITSSYITNWNTAYSWGNHANAGYLTSFTETDPIFGTSVASGITEADTANWSSKQDPLVAGTGINITANTISATGIMPDGTSPGEMLYWNGNEWVAVDPGTNGQTLSFCNNVPVWGGCIPLLTTTSISDITANTATSGGNIANDRGFPVTARGVCWSTSSNPTTANNFTSDGNGTGTFVSNLTGLIENTLFYVRAYATNSAGTGYGNEISFSIKLPCPGAPTVLYEDQTYNTVMIGTQCWFKENLNVGTRINGTQEQGATNGIKEKYCYDNLESNCDIYGGLYQWNEMMQGSLTPGVQGICPTGWHIPTSVDWTTLASILGGYGEHRGKMKTTGTIENGTGLWYSPNTGATNESGFTAFPGGLRIMQSGLFDGLGYDGTWWSSSEAGPLFVACTGLQNYYEVPYGILGECFRSEGFSVRCLRDF